MGDVCMLPDCIALKLDAATRMLERAGICSIEVIVTGPPRGGEPAGDARVVRQRVSDEGNCELVVAYREYMDVPRC